MDDDAQVPSNGVHRGRTVADSSPSDGDAVDQATVDHKMGKPDSGVNGYVDDDEHEHEDSRDTQCGVGSCRPEFARPLGSMWTFTAAMSISTIVANMNFTYYSAVITQIERRFGLSSAMTGFIKNVDNIGFMLTVLAVSHLGRHANKSRILATSSFLSGIAIFLFALPHFMYGGSSSSSALVTNETFWNASHRQSSPSNSTFDMCTTSEDDGSTSASAGRCEAAGRQAFAQGTDVYAGAVALFVVSELMQGMAISPKTALTVTYMDDNAKDKSPQHVG
jgi:MFS family permease